MNPKHAVRTLAVGVVCWGALGCAAGLRTQAEGGPEWHEFQTPHFIIRTDAEQERVQKIATTLEDAFYVLEHTGFTYTPIFNGQTEVVFLSDQYDLSELGFSFTGLHTDQYAWYTGMPTIVLSQQLSVGLGTAKHELVHRFVAFHMPQAPTWLNEGLAQYFETLRVEDQELIIGEHPLTQLERASGGSAYFNYSGDLLDMSQLRQLSHDDFYREGTRDRNYQSAWSLVSALEVSSRRPQFRAYLNALQAAEQSEDEAWREHLAPLEAPALSQSQRDIVSRAAMEALHFKEFRRPPAPTLVPRQLSAARTHALYARLAPLPQALAHARRARELDPNDPEGILLTYLLDRELPDQVRFDGWIQAYEKSGRSARYGAALLLCFRTDDPSEVPQYDAIAAHLTKTATSANELQALARYLLRRNRLPLALKYARQAAHLNPSNVDATAVLAQAEAAHGLFAEAARHQSWVVNWGHQRASAENLALLEEYRRQAAAGAAAAGAAAHAASGAGAPAQ